MQKLLKHIFRIVFLIFMSKGLLFAQTPGINYQALILNSEEIQIPGTNVEENQVLLTLEDVSFRFSILNASFEEYYIETQSTITDENGMVSLIVGEGTPLLSSFDSIAWDGTLKYLNIEIDIHRQNQGFVFLDIQKILYLPQSGMGATLNFVDFMGNLPMMDNVTGDLMWVKDVDQKGNPSLMVWDGEKWSFANTDYDPENELGLVVASNSNDRDLQYPSPTTGDQVWNQTCECIQIYEGSEWVNINGSLEDIKASNGINIDENTEIKLGGVLTAPTEINTDATNTLALTGLEEITPTVDDDVMMVNSNTGVITRTTLGDLFQEEVTLTIAARNGQSQFATPLPIETPNKVNVYRNGVRIGFSVVSLNTVRLEPEAVCYQGDEIRIVQYSN